MYVQRRRKRPRLDIWTPAKLNLFLEVLRRRQDGYHEIETLMVPVALFDTLRVAPRPDDQIRLTVRWADGVAAHDPRSASADLPQNADNLVVQALERLRSRACSEDGISPAGIDVQLIKRIPIAAGLGGGSSDAAAALVGANEVWRLGWSRQRLAVVAAELGSDIPFFLDGGAAACRGRGEQVEAVDAAGRIDFVLVRPPQGLATADVYRQVRVAEAPREMTEFLQRFRSGRPGHWSPLAFNRLQSAASSLAPWMESLRREFDALNLLGHQLSGSGSSYFGICRHRKEACRAASVLRSRCDGRVFCLASVTYPPGNELQTTSQN